MSQPFSFVFPGQGSQFLGMLKELAVEFPCVTETFQEASDVLHDDLWDIVQRGPEERLNQTEITQPAMLAADIAVFRCWQSLTPLKPKVMAGHSLGEFAALVVAEVLPFQLAIELVAKRGWYMQQAVPVGVGAMAAIIGLTDAEVEVICETAQEGQIVAPANFNSIGQVVIAGDKAAVQRAIECAKAKGAKIAKLIPVSVPSHSRLMQPAADQLQNDLMQMTLQKPVIPVIHNATVLTESDSGKIATLLVEQLVSPVRWVETIQKIVADGISIFVECGPGNVLSGLIKRIERLVTILPTGTSELLSEAQRHIAEHQKVEKGACYGKNK
ncbi:MAG: [acyl-carrier-protein] S-malonyltransferase [Coxiella sp. RIFCSPHIGHO2_12_FULL_42_15]|nr:MAG: [acyl-carrier-protein] S-malonyltransferase [Coxiella sp. RIFCSPHIGHO2_12_FULL_42_15]